MNQKIDMNPKEGEQLSKYWGQEEWRDGSVIRNTDCSSKGSWFSSQFPHGDPKPSVIPVARYLCPPLALQAQSTHMVHIHTDICTANKNK